MLLLAALSGCASGPEATSHPPSSAPTPTASSSPSVTTPLPVGIGTIVLDPEAPPASVSQFDNIRQGMSYPELFALLGPATRDLCFGRICLEWTCVDGRHLVASWPATKSDTPDVVISPSVPASH